MSTGKLCASFLAAPFMVAAFACSGGDGSAALTHDGAATVQVEVQGSIATLGVDSNAKAKAEASRSADEQADRNRILAFTTQALEIELDRNSLVRDYAPLSPLAQRYGRLKSPQGRDFFGLFSAILSLDAPIDVQSTKQSLLEVYRLELQAENESAIIARVTMKTIAEQPSFQYQPWGRAQTLRIIAYRQWRAVLQAYGIDYSTAFPQLSE
jgi:hypothetical protein